VPGEDIDDFALRLNTLLQKLVQFGDDTYGEERAVEKLFRCIPEKYKQMARSIESLLDFYTMTIKEALDDRDGGGAAGSIHCSCEHRTTSSGTGRNGSPP
jgi:hypothetical protein